MRPNIAARLHALSMRAVLRIKSPRSFLGALARLGSGSTLAQLITIVGGMLLARIYGPHEFANYGLFLAALGIANTIATLTYADAIISARRSTDAEYLLLLCSLTAIPMAALATLALYLAIRTGALGFSGLPVAHVWIFFPAVLSYATFMVLRQWYVREASFSQLSRELLAHSSSRLLAHVVLGLSLFQNIGLALGETISRLLVSMLMLRKLWPQLLRTVRTARPARLLQTARDYSQFPKYGLPSNLIDNAGQSLPIPLIILYFGDVSGGLFVFAQRVFACPIALIGRSIADVLHHRLALERQRDPLAGLRLLDKTCLYLLLLGVPPCLAAFLAAPILVPRIFGEQWSEAGYIIAAIAPYGLAQFTVSPLSQCFSVYHAHRLKIIYDVLSLVVCIGTIAGASYLNMTFVATVQLFSTANVIAYAAFFLLMRQAVSAGHLRNRAVDICVE